MSDEEKPHTVPRVPLKIKVPKKDKSAYIIPGEPVSPGSPPSVYYNVNTPPPDEFAPPIPEPVGEGEGGTEGEDGSDREGGSEGVGDREEELAIRRRKRRKEGDYANPHKMHYTVEDKPLWFLCFILGFQHYLVMFGASIACPLLLAKYLCIADSDGLARAEIIGTVFVVSGITTLLQSTLGIRLPIVQGGSFSFITPSVALLSLDIWKCPSVEADTTSVPTLASDMLLTTGATDNETIAAADAEPIWYSRIRELQGAIMVASLFQVLIGFSGLMGWFLQFVGPLCIAPTVALVGLSLFDVATDFAQKQWWITLVTVLLIAAFSQYTKNIQIPWFNIRRNKGCVRTRLPLFRLFPVILAIAITWLICLVLTATGVFPNDPGMSGAATNLRIDVLNQAPWFRFSYPGQWGLPTVSSAGVFGMLAAVTASMMESVGDYYACARMCQVPPPPTHAVNRGIGMEGICCIIAGAFGSGSGSTSYSENIGAIGITKVASRRVIQVGAVIMIIMGSFGKFGAFFVTIPDPIVGGVFIVMFGMIAAVGLSNLQFVDLNSSRNLFIIGFSLFFGLALPKYLQDNPNSIQTGAEVVDQILYVLLRTSMFVGGLSGFVLDNTIPGSEKERGLLKWREELVKKSVEVEREMEAELSGGLKRCPLALYEIPYLTHKLRKYAWTKYVPFLPTFEEKKKAKPKRKRKRKDLNDEHVV